MRIIVSGLIAQYPLGGVAWDYLQYVLGLRDLGHDVFYVEETGEWPYNPETGGVGKDFSYNIRYLAGVMERFGLAGRWSYRIGWQGDWYGMADDRRAEVIGSADLLLNVSGALRDVAEYRPVRCLAFIDSDPVFTQIKVLQALRGEGRGFQSLDVHDRHFTFGEAVAVGASAIPATPQRWIATRQPVVLDAWDMASGGADYTTVMNWTSYDDIVFDGRGFGQKDSEFLRFLDLPARLPQAGFRVALSEGKTRRSPRQMLERAGWTVERPDEVCPDMDSYRRYIAGSRAEWSVAKNGYVAGKSGWFSCRSACYLAAGRPVVVQSTGFEPFVPAGRGVLSFADMDGAVAAVEAVEADYPAHVAAARDIAAEYFDASKVLSQLVDACG